VSLHLCLSPYATGCYGTDRVLSCYTNGGKYSIGNLTTNSYWGYAGPVFPVVTGPFCWVSNPNDWLESLPQPNRTYDLDPQIYRLFDSTHRFLFTNPSLTKNCWLCLFPSLSQVLATLMDSLGTLPGKILGLALTRPDIVKVKLTHPAPQCLQSLHGSRPLREIPKEHCVKNKTVN
jgi:hypothetical protein